MKAQPTWGRGRDHDRGRIGDGVFRLVRGEMSSAAITLLLLAMATFVAYMRHRVLPIGVQRAA